MEGVAFSRTGYCVGDNVTFTCTLPLFGHQWNAPGFDRGVLTTTMPQTAGPDNRFTLAVVNSSASGIITSLSVKVYSGFNGANITCSDGSAMSSNIQTAIATVLSKISKCL